MKKVMWLAAAFCLLTISTAIAQGPKMPSTGLSTSVDLGYVSKYVWRGIAFNPDPVFQPSITVSHPSGLSLNLWGSMDTTSIAGKSGDFTEADYTLNYAWEANGREMNLGLAYYSYPNTSDPSTSEVYMSMCLGGVFYPSITVYYDIDEAESYYLTLSAGKDCVTLWNKTPQVNLLASVGYGSSKHNSYYAGVDKSALTDATISAGMPYSLKNGMTLTPVVSYSIILDSGIKAAMKSAGVDRNNFYAGVTLSTSY